MKSTINGSVETLGDRFKRPERCSGFSGVARSFSQSVEGYTLETSGGLNRSEVNDERKYTMLWTIALILLILWLLGFSFHIAGGLIHIVLVIAVIVVIIRLVTGRAP